MFAKDDHFDITTERSFVRSRLEFRSVLSSANASVSDQRTTGPSLCVHRHRVAGVCGSSVSMPLLGVVFPWWMISGNQLGVVVTGCGLLAFV